MKKETAPAEYEIARLEALHCEAHYTLDSYDVPRSVRPGVEDYSLSQRIRVFISDVRRRKDRRNGNGRRHTDKGGQ